MYLLELLEGPSAEVHLAGFYFEEEVGEEVGVVVLVDYFAAEVLLLLFHRHG